MEEKLHHHSPWLEAFAWHCSSHRWSPLPPNINVEGALWLVGCCPNVFLIHPPSEWKKSCTTLGSRIGQLVPHPTLMSGGKGANIAHQTVRVGLDSFITNMKVVQFFLLPPTRSRIQFDIHRVGDTLLHVRVGTFLSCGNGFSIKGRPYWGHPSGLLLWVNNARTDVHTD